MLSIVSGNIMMIIKNIFMYTVYEKNFSVTALC